MGQRPTLWNRITCKPTLAACFAWETPGFGVEKCARTARILLGLEKPVNSYRGRLCFSVDTHSKIEKGLMATKRSSRASILNERRSVHKSITAPQKSNTLNNNDES